MSLETVTIENLDTETLRQLHEEAGRCGLDIGTVAGRLLKESLRRRKGTPPDRSCRGLEALAGTWSNEEAEAFLSVIADFNKIDRELWR